MQNIRENEIIIEYSTMLENELNKYVNNPEELYLVDDIITDPIEWKFAKDGNILYPHPYFNEIMGYKTGKFTNKKFSSLKEASDKKFCIYGIASDNRHIITIDSSSAQFGSFLRCFIYSDQMIKMLPIRFPRACFDEDKLEIDKSVMPNIRNLVYFFWINNESQIILSKGLSNKNTLIDQIIYKNNIPKKYITNRIEGEKPSIISFDFIYKNDELEMIKHDSSDYCLYIKK